MTDISLSHLLLDLALLASLAVTCYTLADLEALFSAGKKLVEGFPFLHYKPVYDFTTTQFPPAIAVSMFVVDLYFLLKTYVLERVVVDNAHKKYRAHKTTVFVAVHGSGSSLEFALGLAAVLRPESKLLAHATALLALLVNVPSGFALNPGVFGIKHLTIPGFALFGVLRAFEAIRILYGPDHRIVANLWILLHVGTMVRLMGYLVLPYTSVDSKPTSSSQRGDLFTDPTVYSFNILLSGYLIAAFVYPPQWLLGSLIVFVIGYHVWPPKLKSRAAALKPPDTKKES